MGFNFGSFAGGAADGYRKQMEEQRKKEAADREKKQQDRQDKEWERQDKMQAELDAQSAAWSERFDPKRQQQAWDEQQASQRAGDATVEMMRNPPAVTQTSLLDKPLTDAEIIQGAQRPSAPAASVMGGKSADQAMGEAIAMPQRQPASRFAPTQPTMIDRMNYLSDRIAIKNKYGKAGEGEMMQMYQTIKSLKDEGVDTAVAKMHAGDIEGALQGFNEVGQYRGAKVVGQPQKGTYKYAGQDMPTTIVTLQLPDGTQQTINTAEYGVARFKMDQAFKLMMDGKKLEQDTLNQNETRAESRRHNRASEGIQARELDVRQAEAEAKRAKEKREGYKTEATEVSSALGKPAVDEKGNAMMDALTGRQVVNRDLAREKRFYKFMERENITDTNEALQKFLQQEEDTGPADKVNRPPLANFSK